MLSVSTDQPGHDVTLFSLDNEIYYLYIIPLEKYLKTPFLLSNSSEKLKYFPLKTVGLNICELELKIRTEL